MNILDISDVRQKLQTLSAQVELALNSHSLVCPATPGRDIPVLSIKDTRGHKLGFSQTEGIARMLHDVANIELQAMEIGFRSLIEYPLATPSFKEKLANVVLDEGTHLNLCLDELENLGFKWGDFPIHLGLWNATQASDSFLDRILIIHCYLEGSGLDAQEKLMRRLSGVPQKPISLLMNKIFTDEKRHVRFGCESYLQGCKEEKLDADFDFKSRTAKLFERLPQRLEPPSATLRSEVGFTSAQIQVLMNIHHAQKNKTGFIPVQ